MIVIGLTGPSGGGKGYVGKRLSDLGIPCMDTDAMVHSLYAPRTPCVADLTAAFGRDILSADGSIDRRVLSAIVFADPKRLEELNSIVHRYVLDEVRGRLRQLEASGTAAAVVDAPQLFESGFDRECDVTLAVLADPDVRLNRLRARDGLSEEQLRSRMSSQHDNAFFEINCDAVIRNNGSEDIDGQIDAFLSRIGVKEGRL